MTDVKLGRRGSEGGGEDRLGEGTFRALVYDCFLGIAKGLPT